MQIFGQFRQEGLLTAFGAVYFWMWFQSRGAGKEVKPSAMKKKQWIVSYFLTTLLFCGFWLHAGKFSKELSGSLQLLQKEKTLNVVVKAKVAEPMGRFIPSVLLF